MSLNVGLQIGWRDNARSTNRKHTTSTCMFTICTLTIKWQLHQLQKNQFNMVCVIALPNPTTSTCSLSRQGAKHGAHATNVSRHGCASKLAADHSCSVRHHERRRNEPTNPILAQTPSKTRMLLQYQVCCNDDDNAEPYYVDQDNSSEH